MKKIITIALVLLFCLTLTPAFAKADETPGWHKDAYGKYYINEDGSRQSGEAYIDGDWYYFKRNETAGNYYALCDGVAQTKAGTWSQEKRYYREDGRMAHDGWILIKNSEEGKKITGDRENYGYIYAKENGALAQQWFEVDGKRFYFYEEIWGYPRRLEDELIMVYELGNEKVWYAFDKDGQQIFDRWVTLRYLTNDPVTTYVNKDGKIEPGFVDRDGHTFYIKRAWEGTGLDGKGTGMHAPQMAKNEKYVFDSYTDENDNYHRLAAAFDENGYRVKNGWWKDPDCRSVRVDLNGKYVNATGMCYADKEGVLVEGWQTIDGKKYYFDDFDFWAYNGGTFKIDDEPQTFDDDGVWQDPNATPTPTPTATPKPTAAPSSGSEEPVSLNGASLTLEGQITINFFVQLPEGSTAKTVKLTYAKGGTKTYTLDKTQKYYDSKNDEYKLPFPNIPAKEMTVPVTLKVYDADGNELSLEHYKLGSMAGNQYSYCVADWARNIIGSTGKKAETVYLAKALLNYGDYAQKYFKYNTSNPANPNGYLASEMGGVSANGKNDAVIPADAKEKIGYSGASLILEGATSVRLYFTQKVEAKNASGKAYTLQQSGKEWYVEIPNIASKDLDEKYVVIVTKDGKDYRFEYSALSYANGRLTNAKAKTDIKNLCKALYLYNDAANKYFK